MISSEQTRKLLLVAAILQLVWGLVPGASKFVIDEIPVELYIAVRWTISGTIFGVYLFLTKSWKPLAPKDIGWITILGILGYGFASFGTLYGLKAGGVTTFALLGALGPVITSILSVLILREKPLRLFYFALPMSVFGLILLAVGKYQISSFAVAGASIGFILSGYILEALVFVYSKKSKEKMNVVQYLTITQISTAIFMWLLQGMYFHQTEKIWDLSAKGMVAAVFVSVVACVLCYAVLYWLLNYIDGHRLALFDGFHTLSATLFGYLIFREPLRPLMLVGGLFILIGLLAGNLPQHATEEVPE